MRKKFRLLLFAVIALTVSASVIAFSACNSGNSGDDGGQIEASDGDNTGSEGTPDSGGNTGSEGSSDSGGNTGSEGSSDSGDDTGGGSSSGGLTNGGSFEAH